MASADEAMGGESSSDPLSPDDEERSGRGQRTREVDDDDDDDDDDEEDDEDGDDEVDNEGDDEGDDNEDEAAATAACRSRGGDAEAAAGVGCDDNDSSSLSSEDSFESDLESESFTDVTPLHSISNSPLPTQPINTTGSKLRDSLGHIDGKQHTEELSSSDDDDEDDDDDDDDKRRRRRHGDDADLDDDDDNSDDGGEALHAGRRSDVQRRRLGRGLAEHQAQTPGKTSGREGRPIRRATVKRAPNRAAATAAAAAAAAGSAVTTVLQQNGAGLQQGPTGLAGSNGSVGHLTDAIQKLGLRSNTATTSANNNNISSNGSNNIARTVIVINNNNNSQGGGSSSSNYNNNNHHALMNTTAVRSRRLREQEQRLEVENQHLLRRIIAQKSSVAELVSADAGAAMTRPQHIAPSAINRKRHHKLIHAQNLALHKRIEAARNGSLGAVNGLGANATGVPGAPSRRPPPRAPLIGGTGHLLPRQRAGNR